MSRNYDHHWKKGYEKQGVPLGIPTAAQAFWAKERAKAKKRKRKKAARAPHVPATAARVQALSPVRIAGEAIESARKGLAEIAEHVRRLEEFVGPILEGEGYGPDQFIPGSLTTKLVLADREIDARLIKRLIAARSELDRARAREQQCAADYARAKADESARPRPPWLD